MNVTISEEQKRFLDAHPEVNLSGLLRVALDELMMKLSEDR